LQPIIDFQKRTILSSLWFTQIIDSAQELLVKQLFIAIPVCSIKRWSPQQTHAPGATRLRSTCLHAPQPDECRYRYRCHQYTAELTFTGDRCGPRDSACAGSPKLASLPFHQRVLQTLWVGCWTSKMCAVQ